MRFSRFRFFIRSFPCFWEHAEMYMRDGDGEDECPPDEPPATET